MINGAATYTWYSCSIFSISGKKLVQGAGAAIFFSKELESQLRYYDSFPWIIIKTGCFLLQSTFCELVIC